MRLIRITKTLVLLILAFVVYSIIYLTLLRSSDLRLQKNKFAKLENTYETYQEKTYEPFANKNLDNVPYNETKFLASHNSYKRKGSFIGKFFVMLGDSYSEAKALNYSYDTLTEQLQNGITSFELDLRLRRNNFEVTHVPLVDNSSTLVNFELGLKEIKLFLDNEPSAFPLLIILEIKDDYMFLDPLLKKIGDKELDKLGSLIEDTLEDKLVTPKQLTGNYSSIMERINNDGWPTVGELKGKAMFVIHAGKYATKYVDNHASEGILFTSKYKGDETMHSPFIIHNSLDVDSISELVEQNYMVRTRIGGTTNYTEDDYNKALSSGAQILTSDFTIARSDIKEYLYLENKKTIIG